MKYAYHSNVPEDCISYQCFNIDGFTYGKPHSFKPLQECLDDKTLGVARRQNRPQTRAGAKKTWKTITQFQASRLEAILKEQASISCSSLSTWIYHSGENGIPADSPTPSSQIFLRQTCAAVGSLRQSSRAWPKSAKLIFAWRPQTRCQTMRWVECCRPIQSRKTTLARIMQDYVSETTLL